MKNKIYITVLFLTVFGIIGNAQIKANQSIGNFAINTGSIFLDASSSTIWNSTSAGATNLGKGFAFPNADLSKLTLTNSGPYIGSNNPSKFDGTVVYNTVTSATTLSGISVAVTPGFYYFSNPNRSLPTLTTALGGTWTRIGGKGVIDIPTTLDGVATAVSIDGALVYAIKGQFTTILDSAVTTIVPPTGITGIYRITIFKGTSSLVYSPSVHSFDLTKAVDNVVTGDAIFTQVYPVGTYNYTLEYFK
jgi:hypothetical protein